MTNPNESKEQALIELSKRVAEKLEIEAYVHIRDVRGDKAFWLHEDSKRCFDLMCERGVNVEFKNIRMVRADGTMEYYGDFQEDASLASRVAILKAILFREAL